VFEAGPELRDLPIGRICDDGLERDAGVQDGPDMANAMRHFSRKPSIVGIPAELRRTSELSAQKMRPIPQYLVRYVDADHKAHFHATG
jgi:hypothetical protein